MALIMVDYENVYESAFIGNEFLNSSDEIIFFYSKNCPRISLRILYSIIDTGCSISRAKLKTTRPDALDFYIVTTIGEKFGSGYDGEIIILSRDKGFESVVDYWKDHKGRTVILAKDIATGLIHTSDTAGRDRRCKVHEFLEQCPIETNILQLKLKRQLKGLISSGDLNVSESDIDNMCRIGLTSGSPKSRYLECLKAFGKSRGLFLYSILRQCHF